MEKRPARHPLVALLTLVLMIPVLSSAGTDARAAGGAPAGTQSVGFRLPGGADGQPIRGRARGLSLLFSANRSPAQAGAQTISRVQTTRPVMALTFDAGADRGYAGRILSTLERAHVRASFGMTGRWAESNKDLVRRMARDGDTFINHTYDHRSFTGLSTKSAAMTAASRIWEINRTESIVRRLTGRTTKPYFRPPYGDYDAATLTEIRRLGYRYMVMWTTDSLGWEGLPAASIVSRVLAQATPGAILLMHVGAQSQDALALPRVIAGLKSRGYRLVTIPQLLAGR